MTHVCIYLQLDPKNANTVGTIESLHMNGASRDKKTEDQKIRPYLHTQDL